MGYTANPNTLQISNRRVPVNGLFRPDAVVEPIVAVQHTSSTYGKPTTFSRGQFTKRGEWPRECNERAALGGEFAKRERIICILLCRLSLSRPGLALSAMFLL